MFARDKQAHSDRKEGGKATGGLLITLGALALVVIGGLTLRLAVASSALTTRETRAAEAEAARWTGLAQAALRAEQQARRDRSLAADAARWTGRAQAYAELTANRERSWAADAARWTGLAEAYGQPASSESIARGWNATSARYSGLAIQRYVETGDQALLPRCLSSGVLSLLPAIGDNGWRAQVPLCGE